MRATAVRGVREGAHSINGGAHKHVAAQREKTTRKDLLPMPLLSLSRTDRERLDIGPAQPPSIDASHDPQKSGTDIDGAR
jgi:hypothetical protein